MTSQSADLVVVGAGPAGIEAACTARETGLDVVLVDEAPAAGGQVYRALPLTFRAERTDALGPDFADGEALRARLQRADLQYASGCRVFLVAPGFRIDAVGPSGVISWTAPALIVATGATERVVAFPGWTTPGVFGLAAATVMLKSQCLLLGGSTVVAGCGPLLAAVAYTIIKAGGIVAAVIDLASAAAWTRGLGPMLSRPDLLARGLGWMARIARSGAPLRFRSTIVGVEGGNQIEAVHVKPVDRSGRVRTDAPTRRIACDSLVVGHGLVPNTDLTRALNARHVYAHERGGWIAESDADMRTSVPQLYVAGDGGGISGAAAAALQGRLAGLTAAYNLGRLDTKNWARLSAPVRAQLARAERFGRAMSYLMAMRPALAEAIPPDCVVCRCEDVTRAEIEEAISVGAVEVNQVKQWTRCGMGPCQGKICGETVASLVAARVGGRERAGSFTARPPFRPVPTDALVGGFDYDDIPIPPPAPL